MLFDDYNECCNHESMALGKNVKRFREAAGLTQTQLADRAGMDQQALGQLENRDSKSSSFTAKIADALGKSVNELLGIESDSSRPARVPPHFVDSDELIKLIDLYRQATPKGRREILDSAQAAKKVTFSNRTNAAND